MRAAGSLLAILGSLALGGCTLLDDLQGPGAAVRPLEVWNRTLDDVFVVDDGGRLISVPACGHAGPAPMAVDSLVLRMDAGPIAAFGVQGFRGPLYLVVVAEEGSSPTDRRPEALPVCAGHPAPALL